MLYKILLLVLLFVLALPLHAQDDWTALLNDQIVAVGIGREAGGAVTIVAQDASGILYVLGDENGRREMLWMVELPAQLHRHGIHLADLNGDGVNEILVSPGRLHVFSRDGALLWSGEERFFAPPGNNRLTAPAHRRC